MISQDDLQNDLAKNGRPVTRRRLTDWRSKHLLPRLHSRGRGTGKGKHYFWTEPDILERALFVHEAFAHGATTKAILLALLWAGFSVPAKLTRQIWIKRLTFLERDPRIAIKRGEFADDHYWDLVWQWSAGPSGENDHERLLAVSILKIVYDVSGFRPAGENMTDVITAGNNWLSMTAQMAKLKYGTDIKEPFIIGEKQISRLTLLIRKAISATETKVLLKDATILQFEQASEYLQVVVALALAAAASLLKTTGKAENPNPTIRAMFRTIIGPTLFTLILRLIVDGNIKRVEKTKVLCLQLVEKIQFQGPKTQLRKRLRAEVELRKIARAFIAELLDIWGGYNLFKLYNIS